ncbi:hypothetical protein [Rhizobium mesosinicum]|uniref:Uncharacterized protein n=1 Tax=Rhizobium mesosinicum TaxID=335017 RepID=A0ABS7H2P2_9HYPH|nr:hypothetical protein [Rhizobium mesosinicum]MBW9056191.1 hypothetical protein [Rhizobium mesosinicum]
MKPEAPPRFAGFTLSAAFFRILPDSGHICATCAFFVARLHPSNRAADGFLLRIDAATVSVRKLESILGKPYAQIQRVKGPPRIRMDARRSDGTAM